jgi:hypothetical protein
VEVVLAVALAAGTGLIVGRLGGPLFENLLSGIGQLVGGYRSETWPRGIQEEDPDQPWGHPKAAAKARSDDAPRIPTPVLTRVKPTVHPR